MDIIVLSVQVINISPFNYEIRDSNELSDLGGDNFPVVIYNIFKEIS